MDQIIFPPYTFPLYFSPICTTKMLYSAPVDSLWGFSSSLGAGLFLSSQSCVQRAVLGCLVPADTVVAGTPPAPPKCPQAQEGAPPPPCPTALLHAVF